MPTLKITKGIHLTTLLAMCCLVASTVGILINTGGLFFSPIAAELGKKTAAVNLTLTISNIMFAVAGIVSARIINGKNFKLMLILCTAVYTASTAGLALCHALWSLYVLSAVRGFFGGMIGNVLATTVLGYWFQTDTGLISSLALGCSGIIGALLNPVLEAIMKVSNWRTAYLAAAAAVLLLNLPAILFPVTFQPADAGTLPLKAEERQNAGNTGKQLRTGDSHSIAVFVLAGLLCSLGAFISATPQLFKSLAVSRSLEGTGVLMMTVVLITNTGGKFLFGAMTDRLGVKLSVLIYGAVIAAGLMLLYRSDAAAAMLISAGLIGLCYSLPTVGAVMICRELFSPERYTKVYPKIALFATVCNALGYSLLGAIYDRANSYDPALLLVFGMTAAVMATAIVVYRLADRESRQKSAPPEG